MEETHKAEAKLECLDDGLVHSMMNLHKDAVNKTVAIPIDLVDVTDVTDIVEVDDNSDNEDDNTQDNTAADEDEENEEYFSD